MRLLSSTLATSLLLAPALLAQVRPPEVEPNDTAATATALALGTEMQANLIAAEQDWFTFTIASAARVQIHTAGLDTRIALYDAAGTTIIGMDDDGRGSANAFSSALWMNLAAGTYTVQVVGYSATTTGAYSIEYGVWGTKTYTHNEIEPNNAYTAATPIAIPAGGAQVNGNIAPATVVLSDAAAAGSTTTVLTATAPLTASAYTGGLYQARYTSGLNAGLFRQISANTATTITTSAFPNVPAVGDTYVVEKADVDFYQFTLTAPRTGLWFLVTEGEAPSVYGHRYELYDAAGALLLASSTTAAAYGTNAANSSSLSPRTSSIRVWPAGTYNLAIRYSNSQFAAPYNQIQTGNYCLELFADMTIGTGSTVAESEPNNTVATATPLTFGQRGTGNLTISTGADPADIWGPFVLPAGSSVVTFQSGRGAPTPIADTTVNILRADGTVALSATTGNVLDWTSHGRTSLAFNGGGTYYVEVRSPGTSTTTQQGDYVVEVSTVANPPYVSPSWTAAAANNVTCGVAPFPTLTRSWASELPVLGEVFARNVANCPANAAVIMMIGLSNTTWNGVPLPFDLAPLGAAGCTLNVDPLVLDVALADGAGVAQFNLSLPSDLAARGFFLWEQAVVQNAAANTFGVQLSNFARIIAGERSF